MDPQDFTIHGFGTHCDTEECLYFFRDVIFGLLRGFQGPFESLMKVLVRTCMRTRSLQTCPSLCTPMDRRPPGCSVHGTLQARILEWVAMLSFRASYQLRDRTHISHLLHWQVSSLPLMPLGKPPVTNFTNQHKFQPPKNAQIHFPSQVQRICGSPESHCRASSPTPAPGS